MLMFIQTEAKEDLLELHTAYSGSSGGCGSYSDSDCRISRDFSDHVCAL